MSGGFFDYNQFSITEIKERLNKVLHNAVEHGIEEEEVYNQLERGLEFITLAEIYTHRIDWLLSGDDGEYTFLEKLEEDLEEAGLKEYM